MAKHAYRNTAGTITRQETLRMTRCVRCALCPAPCTVLRTCRHLAQNAGSSDSADRREQSHCGQLVDKYAEYDFVIIIIDLILHKSQVPSPRRSCIRFGLVSHGARRTRRCIGTCCSIGWTPLTSGLT